MREVLATEMLEALGVYTLEKLQPVRNRRRAVPRRRTFADALERARAAEPFARAHRHLPAPRPRARRRTYPTPARLLVPLALARARRARRAERPVAFVREVARRSAELTASWMVAGFVHGVLNSDNMVVTGESFDYGPYRFLPHYDPSFVAAYFDEVGLYAFDRQPRAVLNNLQRLATSLALIAPLEALRARARRLHAGLFARPQHSPARAARLEAARARCRPAVFRKRSGTFSPKPASATTNSSSTGTAASQAQNAPLRSPAAEHYRARAFEPVAQGFETFAPARAGTPGPSAVHPRAAADARDRRNRSALASHRRTRRLVELRAQDPRRFASSEQRSRWPLEGVRVLGRLTGRARPWPRGSTPAQANCGARIDCFTAPAPASCRLPLLAAPSPA